MTERLTETEVKQVRAGYNKGVTIVSLAQKFGVSRPTIYKAIQDCYRPRMEASALITSEEMYQEMKRTNELLTEILCLLKERI